MVYGVMDISTSSENHEHEGILRLLKVRIKKLLAQYEAEYSYGAVGLSHSLNLNKNGPTDPVLCLPYV